jgi:predicted ATPase
LHGQSIIDGAPHWTYPFATVVSVLALACNVEWLTGSAQEVKRYSEEMVAISNEHGFGLWMGYGNGYCGRSLVALGRTQEGHNLITKALSTIQATGAVLGTQFALGMLAEAHAALGQPREGLNCLAEAMQMIETTNERWCESELLRLRGDLLSLTGDRASAERSYHESLAVARRQSAKTWELRAATSLACFWRDQGKPTEARELLARVYNWFTEGFDTPVLKDAKALLEELSASAMSEGGWRQSALLNTPTPSRPTTSIWTCSERSMTRR